MKIEFSASAVDDLKNIKVYYEDQQVPHIGTQLISDIINHIETLTNNPEIGRVVPEFDEPYIRELIHSPFRIVYTLNKRHIQVIRVWRSERLVYDK